MISIFSSFALAATGCDRFQNDSEATVNQFRLRHIGISRFRLARREMRAVNQIRVRIGAIRVQEPPVFVTEAFFDPRFLLYRKHLNVC